MRTTLHVALTLLPLAVMSAACNGSGPGVPADDKSVEETLAALGVDTTDTPRLDENGDPLPESYSPLGKVFAVEKQSELCLIGVQAKNSTAPLSVFDLALDPLAPPAPPQLLHNLPPEQAAWATESQPTWMPPRSKRAATRADLDGDGREELAVVWFETTKLHLTLIDDAESDWARSEQVLIDEDLQLFDVCVEAGDLDGDGLAELAIAYTLPHEARIVVAEPGQGGVTLVPGLVKTFDAKFPDSRLVVELAVGDLDYDGPQEIALALDEYSAPLIGVDYLNLGATWAVLDDLDTGLATLVQRALKASDAAGVLRTAVVLDVDVGDLDSDGVDEVVVAGLWDTSNWCAGDYVMAIIDDAAHGLERIADTVRHELLGDEPGSGGSGCEVLLRWAHVCVVDFENDVAAEVVVNEMVFADLASAEPWTLRFEIPDSFTLGWLGDASQSAIACGDLTGDGRADVAVWAQGRKLVTVYGVNGHTASEEVELLRTLQVDGGQITGGSNPILLPINVDNDTTVLEFVAREWIITEPMVIAVLAAAPGKEGIGQNTDACVTEYGDATSATTGSEWEVSVSVGLILGYNKGDGETTPEVDFTAKVEGHYQHVWSKSDTLTTSVAYETGPLEDTVVCLVTPYDHYTYRVVADPDPEAIGGVVELLLPRKPISLQVERTYYNDSIGSDELRIDDEILGHTPGAPETYPDTATKDNLIASWGGMQTGPVGVGQGTGATTLGIAVSKETGSSDYLGLSVELELEVTRLTGKKIGGTLGFGGGHTWSRSIGEETTYSGTVGSIGAEHFVEERFAFGVFVYTRHEPAYDQAFDVVQYWVE